ncbi:MAG: hypothetical protein FJZ66_02100 [Bacteroidetes bacterium]|nr:hypothetical protein [Bacteroidota bacterium]
MKFFLIFALFLFYTVSVSAQSDASELEKSYTTKELKTMSPDDLNLLVYALENAIYITEIPQGKNLNLESISVPLTISKFTDAALKIENQNQYYQINGTSKMLVVKSKYVLQNEIKTNKN